MFWLTFYLKDSSRRMYTNPGARYQKPAFNYRKELNTYLFTRGFQSSEAGSIFFIVLHLYFTKTEWHLSTTGVSKTITYLSFFVKIRFLRLKAQGSRLKDQGGSQIWDVLIPTSRLKGDVICREDKGERLNARQGFLSGKSLAP